MHESIDPIELEESNIPFIQTRFKPKRPRLRYLTWPQFFETVLSYRHALTPLIVIICQFFIQAFCEMIVSLYGRYWMISSTVHDYSLQGSGSQSLYQHASLGLTGFLLISGLLWLLGIYTNKHIRRHRSQNKLSNGEVTMLNGSTNKKILSQNINKNNSSKFNARHRNTSLRNSTNNTKYTNNNQSKDSKRNNDLDSSPEKVNKGLLFNWFVLQGNKFFHMSIITTFILIGIISRLSLFWFQEDSFKRCLASSICCTSFLIVFMLSLVYKGLGPKSKPSDDSLMYSIGLSNAFMVVIFWKTVGSTLDWSMHNGWAQIFVWIKAFIALIYCILLLWVYYWRQYVRRNHMRTDVGDIYFEAIIEQEKESMEWWRVQSLCIGLFGNFLLLYMTFGSPAVISRWVRGNYSASVLFQTLAFGGFTFIMSFKPKTVGYLRPVTLRIINIILGVICVALAVRSQFINYHYAFGTQQSLVYIMHFLSPTFLLNIQLICHEILRSKEKVSIPKIAGGFFIATILFLFLVICSAFSVVSSYMEPKWLSRLLFGQHDITFTLMVALASAPMFLIRTNSLIYFNNGVDDIYRGDGRKNFKLRLSAFLFALLIGIGTISVLIWTTPVQYYLNTPPKTTTSHLHIGSYNVRSGFDRNGLLNFSQHYNNLKDSNFDIVALIESDTVRIANGNSDFVRYAANHLAMYSYYGPKPTEGTLGVSFLSKFPIIRRRTKTIVTSANGEKTAIVVSKVFISRKRTVNFIVAHIGLANFQKQVKQLSQELRRITLNQPSNEGTIVISSFVSTTGPNDVRKDVIREIVSEFGLTRVDVDESTFALEASSMRTHIYYSSNSFENRPNDSYFIPHERVNDVYSMSTKLRVLPVTSGRHKM